MLRDSFASDKASGGVSSHVACLHVVCCMLHVAMPWALACSFFCVGPFWRDSRGVPTGLPPLGEPPASAPPVFTTWAQRMSRHPLTSGGWVSFSSPLLRTGTLIL